MTTLVPPLGGRLVDLRVAEPERAELRARAASWPSLGLSERAICDLELLATGAFSPLDRFLGRADHERVLAEMRLRDGTLWPMPILLVVPEGFPLKVGGEIALRDKGGEILGAMTVEEAFPFDPEPEARALLGRADPAHPLVAEMRQWGRTAVSGRLRVLALPTRYDFQGLRATPLETRAALEALGSNAVVAFQTRNPLHRSHEELLRRAVERVGGSLLVHPTVGLTRPGDLDYVTRVRAGRALLDKRFDPRRTLLRLLPLAMRMAGPREALWHALVRRNYGASHFIVGRDHAGPGPDSSGRPLFGPREAQELALRHEGEMGVKIVPSGELVYLPDQDRYEEEERIPATTRVARLSGTEVRERLARGEPLPEWFTRPEVAEVLRAAHPPRFEDGFCVWFTGLPASGKSSSAEALAALLVERGRRVTVLDGDVVRTHLSKGLGFSRVDRNENVLRIGFVAAEIVRHRGVALCAAVSPYRETRDRCRELVGPARFVEVFMDTPLRLCEARDPKGLYARARRGEVSGITGLDDPYEPPERPEVVLHTDGATVLDNARLVVAALVARGDLRE